MSNARQDKTRQDKKWRQGRQRGEERVSREECGGERGEGRGEGRAMYLKEKISKKEVDR